MKFRGVAKDMRKAIKDNMSLDMRVTSSETAIQQPKAPTLNQLVTVSFSIELLKEKE